MLKLVAGGGAYPTPSATNLYFPVWIEWPEPQPNYYFMTPTNQLRVPGETFTLTNYFDGYADLGTPTWQWRKGGKEIGAPSNFTGAFEPLQGIATLTFNNFQPADAGIYDVAVLGNNWFIGPKTFLSVQLTNGPGVFRAPRLLGSNFVADLLGAPGRMYEIQRSTNLLSWNYLLTVTNLSGTVTFSNAFPASTAAFYRARLLPL